MTKEELENLESHAVSMVKVKKQLTDNLNTLIKEAQKLGYSVNPKTGKVKEL